MSSVKAYLNYLMPFPENSLTTSQFVMLLKELYNLIKFASPFLLSGSYVMLLPPLSVTDRLIFMAISSLESVMFILLRQLASLLDIFFDGSVRDITLGVRDTMHFGIGKQVLPTIELNLYAYFFVRSKCCFWSSPTGTQFALYRRMSAAMRTGQEQMPRLLLLVLFSLYWIIMLSQCCGPMHPRIQHNSECSLTSDCTNRWACPPTWKPLLITFLAMERELAPILSLQFIWACSKSKAVVSECRSAMKMKVWHAGCSFRIRSKLSTEPKQLPIVRLPVGWMPVRIRGTAVEKCGPSFSIILRFIIQLKQQ